MQVDVGILIGLAGAIFGIVMGYLNWRKTSDKDIQISAIGQGELRADIKYIRRSVEAIQVEMKVQEKRHGELTERVTRVEEKAASAHRRIDGIEKRLIEE
jgi:5-bromo-4-chloroindolyl phosphate hydrolysis protein